MAYSKTTWVDEVLAGAERFDIKEDGGSLTHGNMQILLKTTVSTPGTSVNATNLNHLEQGVADATLLINRQGGSSTAWATVGATGYAPVAGAWRLQAGSQQTAVTNYGETFMSFPTPFAYAPLVVAQCYSAGYYFPIVYDVTASGFTIKLVSGVDDLCHTGVPFHWIAIGPM